MLTEEMLNEKLNFLRSVPTSAPLLLTSSIFQLPNLFLKEVQMTFTNIISFMNLDLH